jgi:hypothetical protein
MSRNLATKRQTSGPAPARSGRKTIGITCDGCCRPIERQHDLLTVVHKVVLVRGYCSQCYARMTVEFHRRVPHVKGSQRQRFRSRTTPLNLLTRALEHSWENRSTRFPGEPIIQINTVRMTGLLATFGGLMLTATLVSLLSGAGLSGFLVIVWVLLFLLLELRLVSYFRYERHVRERVTEERP